MNTKTAKTKEISTKSIIIVLGCLNGLMPFSTDLYLPAFPTMAENLHTNVGMITLSMSTFFAGACVGQFFNGPLLDRFGRKNPLLIALTLFIITSIACALSQNIIILCCIRFFQAISISMCTVGSRTMVRDLFAVEKIASVYSLLALVMGVAPIIAPTLGSFILFFSDWRGIFFFLALMAFVLILALHFFLPPVKESDSNYSLKPKAILVNYKKVILTKGYLGYTIVTALASAVLFSWISSSSLLFIGTLGVSKQQFGWVFASTATCTIVGSQLNRILLPRFHSQNIAFFAVGMQLLVCAYLLYTTLYCFTILHFLSGMWFFMFFLSLIAPNTMAITIRPFTENIGSANALMGVTQMAFSAITTAILSYFQDGTAVPMVTTMILLCGASFCLQYFLRKKTN